MSQEALNRFVAVGIVPPGFGVGLADVVLDRVLGCAVNCAVSASLYGFRSGLPEPFRIGWEVKPVFQVVPKMKGILVVDVP